MFSFFKRVIKNGWVDLKRNGWLSTATVGIMTLTLCVTLALIVINYLGSSVLNYLQNKIDFSIYFKPDASDDYIKNAQKEIGNLPYVETVGFTSKDQALANFQERNQSNPAIISALEALGENPLSASLNIKAKDAQSYDAIAKFIQTADFKDSVDNVTYYENQQVIKRVDSFISVSRTIGAFLGIVLAFIAILITFNTIRLAIYAQREEINIMRLVGASNWYIRGPFLVAGIIYGIIAAIITVIIFMPIVIWLSPYLAKFLPEVDLVHYYFYSFEKIFLIELLVGVFVGIGSSLIAINRYLKI